MSLASTSSGAKFAKTSGGAAVTSVTIPANGTSADFFYGDTKAGQPTITASNADVSSATQQETISAGAASQFAVSAGSAQTAGTAFSVEVTAQDAFGNRATYSGSHDVTVTTTGGASPGGTAPILPSSINFSGGVGSTSVTLFKAETGRTISVSEGTLTGTSNSTNLTTGAPARLAWTGTVTVSQGVVGTPCYFTCTVAGIGRGEAFNATVSLTDNWGNVVSNVGSDKTVVSTTDRGSVSFATNAILPATGSATTSLLTASTPGNNSWSSANVTAALGGFTSATAVLIK